MAGWHCMVRLVVVYVQVSGIFSQNCTTGSGLLNGQCQICGAGTYYVDNRPRRGLQECWNCPYGTYQNCSSSLLVCVLVIHRHFGKKQFVRIIVNDSTQSCSLLSFSTHTINLKAVSPTKSRFLSLIAVCSPGNYLNATNNVCIQCELGFYQDQNNATSCKSCETGRITLIRGSPSYLYCVVPCPAGRYHTDKVNTAACEKCPVGQYQNASGQQSCLICPSGRTTYLTGSAVCYDICNVGSFFNTTLVSCQYCPPGQYQPSTGRTECSSCPPGYVSTTGATQCQVFCSAGQHIDNRTSQCVPCEIGTYQPETSQTSCISCGSPENWVTNRTGSTSISDCSFFCPSGYYKGGINSCESCPIGTYKDSAIDRFGTCQQCPPDSTTNGTRTTSIAFCNVYLCSPGTFWNLNQTRCQPCQRGTYQPNSGLTSCIPCESSKTTNSTGAIYVNQCIFICQRGYSHNSTTDKCDPCPVGFYQDVADQMFCKTCGFARTTLNESSTSINDCIEMCSSGTQYTSIGNCQPCLRGTYRTAGIGIVVCQNCPNGFTTIGTGTTQISDCNIAACYPGTYRTVNNTCEACPLGTYQPDFYQEFCSLCGPASNWLTEHVGSVRKDQCKFFCPSGYAVASNNTCNMCPIGYYKDNTINVFGLCIQCPNNSLTASPGSTSINNCSLAECPAGYQRDNTLNGCQPCAIGFYQPSVNQNVCISCQPNYSTRSLASDSSSDCELYCPSGQNLQNNSCISCLRGYYKDNAISPFMMCTRCPPNYVTPSTGSTSITNCYVRDCPAGTKRNQNDTGCIDCELGFYQPTPYETSCIQCQSGYSTSTTGSTSVTQCKRYCPPGTELINSTSQCSPCQIGFYSESVFSTVCNKCMNGFITENTGSTSVLSCNIAACYPGTYRTVNNTCVACPLGTYQPDFYQEFCSLCGPASNWLTEHVGSVRKDQCKFFCPSGYAVASNNTCDMCPIGYYKDNTINVFGLCIQCPNNSLTASPGSTSINNCSLAECPAGYQRDNTLNGCQPCAIGFYQPSVNQNVCISCQPNYSTRSLASDSSSDCELYCPSGQNLQNNSCISCLRGYYKDNAISPFMMCTRCPPNYVTPSTGSTSIANCYVRDCPAGTKRNQNDTGCIDCELGFYQPTPYETSCIQCQSGYSTSTTGSTSVTQCKRYCPPGTELINSTSQCSPCQIGFYSESVFSTVCNKCMNGFITENTGSTSVLSCNIAACYPGTYRTVNNTCVACPLGTYQPDFYQEFCSLCGPASNWLTEHVGSVRKDQCKFFCPSGYAVAFNNTCDMCPIGYYKDNTINVFGLCIQCPNNSLTASPGSTSINNCFLAECPAGYQRDNTLNGCQPCAIGFYQPSVNQNVCISCQPNYSTRSLASDSSSDCELYCPSGQNLQKNSCISCLRGYYKDNAISPFMMCTRCPPNYVTPSTGSTSIANCYVRDCPAGTKRNQNDTGCIDCELGFYQPTPYETSCIQCQSGYSTSTTGSTSVTQCKRYCPPGTELINNTSQCSPCQIGFYSESVFSTVCDKCMNGFITENTGSTSVLSCNIVACDAGSYRDVTTNTCQLCPIGEYQDNKYQTSCKPCGVPASIFLWQTNHTGSTSLSECIYHCPSGYELRQDGKCYICPVGQYKDNIMNILSICTVCPDGKKTPGEGAVSQSQCTIRDCPAGYFASMIVDRCIPCGFGEYQPRRNQTGCMNCPTGTLTKQTGSTSVSECFSYCQSGYESVPNNASTCQECERGYYKDNSMGIFSFCTRCPANFTTNRTAAVSSAECNIRICPLGFYINKIDLCTLCPKGMYQDQLFRSSCIPCPPGQTTNSSGSFNVLDCYLVLCPSGEHYLNGVCQPCEIGYYKVGLNADRCQPCSNGIITLSRGSSLPTDCSIPACLSGQYLVAYSSVLECRPCPIGTYQDEIWQRYCKPCQTGYITINTSSISLDACVAGCLDGQVRSNKTGLCVPCPVGTYWTMEVNPKCVPCLKGLLTPAAGSITIADCSISPCQKGYRYIIQREQCEICPRGTYQPQDGKFICNYCPADRNYSSQEGATDVTECRSPCLIGQGFNQNTQQCFDCPVGTYQPNPFSFACIECPNGRKYTNNTGSIQESDCLSYCGSLSRNECSVNATCADDSSVPDGYTCVCKEFYTAKESPMGSKPGRVCIHQCDANFCMNNALCSKTDNGPVCSCSNWYKGERCQERLAAENVMDDKSRWIIPVVIAVVIFILIVIAFIVWFCFRDGFQPLKKSLGTLHYVESRAIVQDNHIYRTPAPNMYAVPKITALTYKPAGNIIFKDGTIKPEPELVYENPRFQRLYENTGFQRLSRRSGDVSVYET